MIDVYTAYLEEAGYIKPGSATPSSMTQLKSSGFITSGETGESPLTQIMIFCALDVTTSGSDPNRRLCRPGQPRHVFGAAPTKEMVNIMKRVRKNCEDD